MRFCDLEVGQPFKFFEGGSVLTKSGSRSYDAPQWGQFGNVTYDKEQTVIPVEQPSIRQLLDDRQKG
jgi:hypothetical protein